MKIKSVLSGIAAILLVSTFYIFAFGIVDEVDDTNISDDYLYVTETSSTESISSDETAWKQSDELQSFIDTEGNEYYFIPDTSSHNTHTDVNTSASEEHDAPEELVESYNDEELFDDNDSEGLNSVEANSQHVYARDKDSDIVLSKLSNSASSKAKGKKTTTTTTSATTTTAATTTEKPAITTSYTQTTPYYTYDTSYYDTTTLYTTFATTAETTVQTTAPVNNPPIGNETLSVRLNGSVQQINAYDLVCMIVTSEMGSSFTDEAIKAQAVAAYCYVKYNNLNGISPSVVASSSVPDRIKSLVSSVWGVACYYNGTIAQTVYCASSAGYTASSVNVWGGNYSYLTSVSCPFDAQGDPNYGITKTFSESEMRSYLEGSLGITLSNDPSKWLTVTSYVDTVYVGSINVDGQKTITGRYLRENILGYRLRSASFNVVYSNGQFIFTTYGYGHGVGMSQNGANILAKQGYTYVDILKYYYTGITVR
jgi:stage II sporulation protein D